MVSIDGSDRLEERVRDGIVRQLRLNLARCRRVILDEKMDLKTRERWTQLYNNTSPGAQPDLERPTDARLGEKTPRNRRIRKYSGRSRAVSSRPHRTKGQETKKNNNSPRTPKSNPDPRVSTY